MSKRLQVVMPDDEYEAVAEVARRRGQPIARVVRDCLRRGLAEGEAEAMSPEERIARILRFARFDGPAADIDQMLREIEEGRGLE